MWPNMTGLITWNFSLFSLMNLLVRTQTINIRENIYATRTRGSETSAFPSQLFTERQEFKSFTPQNKHEHEMNKGTNIQTPISVQSVWVGLT